MPAFSTKPRRDTALLVQYIDDELNRIHAAHAAAQSKSTAAPTWESVRVYDPVQVRARLASLGDSRSDADQSLRRFLEQLLEAPSLRSLALSPTLVDVIALGDEFPNMKAAATAVAASVALARLAAPTSPRWWPLVLEGPPGIGKTYFAERLGELFEVPVHRLGFGHATASFALGGLDAQYSTGGPGWLARTVGLSKHADPLIVLDEIDKCARASNSDPLTPLYSLWDGTAEHFLDDGLRVPLNLSRVRWIATCNDASALPEALLSRCLVVPVAAPSSEQSIRIASRIYVRLLRSAPWGQAFLSVLPDAIAARLAGLSPRDIEKCLYQALGHAALAGRRVLVEEDLPLPDGPRRRKLGFLP